MNSPRTLVLVDDEPEILSAIKRTLMRVDILIETFTSPRLAQEYIAKNKPTMVISDSQMPDIKGMQLLAYTKEHSPETRRILLSAFQDFDVVSEGFNQGVLEQFISKPWNNVELQTLVENAVNAKGSVSTWQKKQGIISNCEAMSQLLGNIEMAAGANVPIFICGETGTGKELVAKACHEQGCKKNGAFIAVNCSNLSENLIESQLFGHKKGAFTGANSDQKGVFSEAHLGTVFLDEITTLPLQLQSKLLRVIQERSFTPLGSMQSLPFDAQIVSASSISLIDAVRQGEFREDLYYRLNVISLDIPPLRARDTDILLLAESFLAKFSKQSNRSFKGFTDEAKGLISHYDWPGNVRQMENMIHGLCIMQQGEFITREMLAPLLIDVRGSAETKKVISSQSSLPLPRKSHEAHDIMPLSEIERSAIEQAIEQCHGNVTQAAALLEVNPSTLYRKMKGWESTPNK